jgi:large subunit ribosomal protein L9
MKIILTEDVTTLGHIGEVVKVADGYARNFLIPKGAAVRATDGNLKQFEAMKEAILKKKAVVRASADELCKKISEEKLSFKMKAGEEDGKLFGSITHKDIATALGEKGYEIDKRVVHIADPIKFLGDFKVNVKLHPEVTAEIDITVEREEDV